MTAELNRQPAARVRPAHAGGPAVPAAAHAEMIDGLSRSAHSFHLAATAWHRLACPVLLDEAWLASEVAVVRRLCELAGALPGIAFGGDPRRFWRFHALPPGLDDLLADDGLGTRFFARPDCVPSGGHLKVVELNIGTGTVNIAADAATRLYFGNSTPYPGVRSLLSEHWRFTELDPAEALAAILTRLGEGQPVGLWHHGHTDTARSRVADMCAVLAAHGADVVPVHTADISGFTGPLYGYFSTVHLVGPDGPQLSGEIRVALRERAGRVLLRPGDLPRNAKGNLAVLYGLASSGRLSDQDTQTVLEHVPETVLIRDCGARTIARVRRDKDDWVVKPNLSFKGTRVHVGRRLTRRQWEAVVSAGGDGVAQRYVPCDPVPMLTGAGSELTVSTGGRLVLMPHILAGRFAGMSARYSADRDVLGLIDFHTVFPAMCVAVAPAQSHHARPAQTAPMGQQ